MSTTIFQCSVDVIDCVLCVCAAGVGATCVLRSAHNSSFDSELIAQINHTRRNYRLLERYFEPRCRDVFVHGITLNNFVPEAGTPDVMPTSSSEETDADNVGGAGVPARTNQTPRYYPLCQCAADNTGFLCPLSGYTTPPNYQAVTSDIVQEITGTKEEDYYLYTTDKYRLHRYHQYRSAHMTTIFVSFPPNLI